MRKAYGPCSPPLRDFGALGAHTLNAAEGIETIDLVETLN